MCILPDTTPGDTLPRQPRPPADCPPRNANSSPCKALAGTRPITQLAHDYDVSRKFVYQQAAKAEQALDAAFAPTDPDAAPGSLSPARHQSLAAATDPRPGPDLPQFLPRRRRTAAATSSIIRSPWAPSITSSTTPSPRPAVSTTRTTLHQRARSVPTTRSSRPAAPVLVGADVASTYCYLLSQEEHRDADTWGVRLLELHDAASPPTPPSPTSRRACGPARNSPARRALPRRRLPCPAQGNAAGHVPGESGLRGHRRPQQMEQRQAPPSTVRAARTIAVAQQLRTARQAEAQAMALAEEVALLAQWLREDILAVAGADSRQPRRAVRLRGGRTAATGAVVRPPPPARLDLAEKQATNCWPLWWL